MGTAAVAVVVMVLLEDVEGGCLFAVEGAEGLPLAFLHALELEGEAFEVAQERDGVLHAVDALTDRGGGHAAGEVWRRMKSRVEMHFSKAWASVSFLRRARAFPSCSCKASLRLRGSGVLSG